MSLIWGVPRLYSFCINCSRVEYTPSGHPLAGVSWCRIAVVFSKNGRAFMVERTNVTLSFVRSLRCEMVEWHSRRSITIFFVPLWPSVYLFVPLLVSLYLLIRKTRNVRGGRYPYKSLYGAPRWIRLFLIAPHLRERVLGFLVVQNRIHFLVCFVLIVVRVRENSLLPYFHSLS